MVEINLLTLGLALVSAFMLGVAVRGAFAVRTHGRMLEQMLGQRATVEVYEQAMGVATEMLDEADRLDEFSERVESHFEQKMADYEALQEIDPLGADQL